MLLTFLLIFFFLIPASLPWPTILDLAPGIITSMDSLQLIKSHVWFVRFLWHFLFFQSVEPPQNTFHVHPGLAGKPSYPSSTKQSRTSALSIFCCFVFYVFIWENTITYVMGPNTAEHNIKVDVFNVINSSRKIVLIIWLRMLSSVMVLRLHALCLCGCDRLQVPCGPLTYLTYKGGAGKYAWVHKTHQASF